MSSDPFETEEYSERQLVAIVRRYREPIRRYARTVCPTAADAEDATQATFVALLESVQLSNRPRAMRPWLLTVARNYCLRLLRGVAKQLAWVQREGDGLSLEAQTQENRIMVYEALEAMEKLDVVAREVLLRRDFLGQSGTVAARDMGLSLAGLKTHLHRARKVVRQSFS